MSGFLRVKKGTNAVWVASAVLKEAEQLRSTIVPGDMDLVLTRNYGLTANEKVNELVEGLAVAILIVVALLTLGLGWPVGLGWPLLVLGLLLLGWPLLLLGSPLPVLGWPLPSGWPSPSDSDT